MHNYVDTWIRTNRTFKLHSFNTKWPTAHFSLLTLEAEMQQHMWMIQVTLQELNITGWKVKITYRGDRYLLIIRSVTAFIHFKTSELYLCRWSVYKITMCGMSVLMFPTLISGTSLARGDHRIHHVTFNPHLDYTAAHIPQMYWWMFCESWFIRNIYMVHNKEPYIYSTG